MKMEKTLVEELHNLMVLGNSKLETNINLLSDNLIFFKAKEDEKKDILKRTGLCSSIPNKLDRPAWFLDFPKWQVRILES